MKRLISSAKLLKAVDKAKEQNPDGFSLSADGKLFTGKGYAVSINGTDKGLTPLEVAQKVLEAASRKLNWVLGYWKDEKTGAEYFDVTMIIHDKPAAMEIAKIHKQIAIYDLAKGESIYL